MQIETDNWPYIAAKYQRAGRRKPVRLIIMHTTESLEIGGSAYRIAKYFQKPTRAGSTHVVVDEKQIFQCVYDSNVAAGAKGANEDGVHIEQVGKAGQSALEWGDPYSMEVIENAARVCAQYCLKFDIPPIRLTDEELKGGQKGIVGHDQVSRVYPGTGHWDPGPNYPWGQFLQAVNDYLERRLIAKNSNSPHMKTNDAPSAPQSLASSKGESPAGHS